MELVYVLGTRPTYTGVAFPEDSKIESWRHVQEKYGTLVEQHRLKKMIPFLGGYLYGNETPPSTNGTPILASEYTGLAEAVLRGRGFGDMFKVIKSEGSTENLAEDYDGILDVIETGSNIARARLRVVHPFVSIHYPVLFMRRDTPRDAAEHIYEIAEHLKEGAKKMDPSAFQTKVKRELLGWD
jgi:ATP phosphoribosyltransferase